MSIDANVLTDYVRANGIGGIDAARMARAIEQTKSVYQFAAEPDAALSGLDNVVRRAGGRERKEE